LTGRKVLVLGATGGTGQEVVSQALQHGHEVTAFARRPERLAGRSERLRLVAGDITDPSGPLSGAIQGQDVLISCLGVGLSFRSRGLMARGIPRIVQEMERHGVTRLIFTSAYGVGETWRDVPPLPRLFVRTLLRDLYADKERGEKSLRQSRLDWTLVYPVALTNGPRTGRYRVGERLELRGIPQISRADLAEFLLAQVEDRSYLRKGVLISY
jgi:putative NADH-flavin reductase